MTRWACRLSVAAALLVAGCAGVQTPLDPAGDQAARVLTLFELMLWVCAIAYALVLIFLAGALLRARGRFAALEPAIDPADGAMRVTLAGWITLVFAGLTLLVVASFFAERGLAGARDREALQVRVTGHQWWWRLQYRDPRTGAWVETANELHLPVDRTARLELGAADVIHSFWVPNVSGKMDLIPGHANVIDVTPHRLGWFRGQCAEFCGVQHAHMAFDVKVETPAAFQTWLAEQAHPAAAPVDPASATGERLVTEGQCAQCHAVRGTAAHGRPGPDLTHLASRRSLAAGTLPMSRGAIQGWIADPQALKPGTMMPAVALSGAEANSVSRYLESLK